MRNIFFPLVIVILILSLILSIWLTLIQSISLFIVLLGLLLLVSGASHEGGTGITGIPSAAKVSIVWGCILLGLGGAPFISSIVQLPWQVPLAVFLLGLLAAILISLKK